MKNKFWEKKNSSLFFAGLVYGLVFFFRFFLQKELVDYDFWKIFSFYFSAFFLLPWGISHFFFHQKIRLYFWGKFFSLEIKNRKREFIFFLAWLGFFSLIMLKFGQWKNFPVSPWVFGRWELFLLLDLTLLPAILFFQEFFYRGFLLKVLTERLQSGGAIVAQALLAIIFELSFLQRGWSVGGIIFLFYCFLGWVSLRGKNFFYSWWIIYLSSLFFDGIIKYKIITEILNN